MIAELLGIPLDDGRRLYQLTEAIHAAPEEAVEPGAPRGGRRRCSTTRSRCARRSGPSPATTWPPCSPHGEVDGAPVDAVDFFLCFLLLVDAGGDTTRNLVGGGMHALFDHPDQLERLRTDLDAVLPSAVEELLRWVSPVVYMRRTATVDTVLAGQEIAEGDKVVMYYGSANRDPACVDDPDRLDLGRAPNPHVAFGGGGPHFCLGAHLARIEIEALLREMVLRLDGLEPAGGSSWMGSNFIFGPTSLPVRFRPGPRAG